MFFKVEGVPGSFGTPKWTHYYCSPYCMAKNGCDRADADCVAKEDVTPNMKCWECERSLLKILAEFYDRYPAERPTETERTTP